MAAMPLALLLAAATALAPDHRWSEAAARARFGAWARPVADATFTVAVAPADARAARLSHFGAFAFADELATSNAANVACRRGRLRVNGAEASGARVVAPGDVLTLAAAAERRTAVPELGGDRWLEKRANLAAALADPGRHAPPLRVLYEDDAMAVVLKPAGVHSMSWKGSLKARQLCLDDVLPLFLEPSASGDALPAPLPRHRLDARVAGPVVVSKTRSAHAFLGREFERGRVAKEYRALLVGGGVRAGVVDAPLDGRPATTRVEVLGETRCAVDGVATDVSLFPATGRRHQLRRHCAEQLGAPILGDDLYDAAARRRIGLYLYCRRVAVAHPTDATTVDCEIDEPPRFAKHRAKAARGWAWAKREGGV